MFDIYNYSDIINHIKSINHGLFKPTSSGEWIQTFCPYCNDKNRYGSSIPTHGHLYLARKFPYGICFRCETSGPLHKFLSEFGFSDNKTIEEIKKFSFSKHTLHISKSLKSDNPQIIDHQDYLQHLNYEEVSNFINYVYSRCYEINPFDFFLYPIKKDDKLYCSVYNFDGNFVTERCITEKKFNKKGGQSSYYFFQNINDIIEYDNIIIAEGVFDIINLYNYSYRFSTKNSFFIAINGRFYNKAIKELISNFLGIDKYHFNIIIDNDIQNVKMVDRSIKGTLNKLNPLCTSSIYKPKIESASDVSDLMYLEKIF